MSRRIITRQLQSINNKKELDTYSDKLLKNIPAEIVAAWISVTNIIKDDTSQNTVLWISFVVGIILTGFWTKRQTDMKKLPVAKTQICIAIGSFVVWVFAIGGPFANLSFYKPLYGSLILILYTVVVPLINPPE